MLRAHFRSGQWRASACRWRTACAQMADQVTQAGMQPSANAAKTSDDLMNQFNLTEILTELRNRKLRSSFMFLINEIPTDVVPLKPRCPAGSLLEIAMQPVNEDERRLELFDERVIRNALTLKESAHPVKMPDWLQVEQPWADDDKRRKRREKKKKKKKKKRKREADDADAMDASRHDDEERRARKKRK